MDGFTSYNAATSEHLPTAKKVIGPSHVVYLAADKLTKSRPPAGIPSGPGSAVQEPADQETTYQTGHSVGGRGRRRGRRDPPHLSGHHRDLTDTRTRESGNGEGRRCCVGSAPAYRQTPRNWGSWAERSGNADARSWSISTTARASNGPIGAINGRLEHLRGIAVGFRNLRHYKLQSMIHSRGPQAKINAL